MYGPARANHFHPPGGICGNLEERHRLEGPQNPHGLGPGGIRRRVGSNCESTAGSGNQEPDAWHGHHFTDAQASIWRMTSDDPGPGQKYAIEARKHITALRAGNEASASKSGGTTVSKATR